LEHLHGCCCPRGRWEKSREGGNSAQRRFLQDNFLSANTLRMIGQMKSQFMQQLREIGFYHRREVSGKTRRKKQRNSTQAVVRSFFWFCCAIFFGSVAPSRVVQQYASDRGQLMAWFRWLIYTYCGPAWGVYVRTEEQPERL